MLNWLRATLGLQQSRMGYVSLCTNSSKRCLFQLLLRFAVRAPCINECPARWKITSWVFKTGFASTWQKGFMPVNGYYGHLFLAQNILHSTYKGKESLYVLYYGF